MGVKQVLRYITYGLKFLVNGHAVHLYAFSDAHWAGDTNNQHSTSEYVFKVAYSTTSWCNKKQGTRAKSSTEVE